MSLLVDIRKKQGDFTLELHLEAEKEILGLLGASGSGKSMTLRCIAGILQPDSGTIELDGRVLFDSKKRIDLPARQRKVGLLFQGYALFPHMTVAENITAGIPDRFQRRGRLKEALALLRLEGLEKRYPHQLSGGQQQRVALARMMACSPSLLMLDEPFSALDSHLRQEIDPEFTAALEAFDRTVIYVSHSISEVYRYCQKTAVLSEGRLLEGGVTESLFAHPRRLGTAKLLCCKNLTPLVWKEGRPWAESWNLPLSVESRDTASATHVGIHSDDIAISSTPAPNLTPARVEGIAMRPRHGVLRLRPENATGWLTVSLSRETAQTLTATGIVYFRLPPEKLLFLEE